MLRAFVDETCTKLLGDFMDVDSLQQLANGRRANVGEECSVVFFLRLLTEGEVLVFGEKRVGFDRLTGSIRHFRVLGNELLLAGIDDDVVRVVDDLLEIAKRQVDEIAHRARQRLEEPDVRDGYGELDVTHALAAYAAQGDFDAATIANDAAIADALVFTAMAFPVLYGTEDALAEQTVFFRLERAVVNGFGLQYLAPRPPGAKTGHLEPLALL